MSGSEKEKGPRESAESTKTSKSPEKPVPFRCIRCGLGEDVHYFGRKPDFVRRQLEFREPSFVMRDPFSPRTPGRAHFLLVGGVCAGCAEANRTGEEEGNADRVAAVCVECSIFFGKRFCLDCASSRIREFPGEVQAKIQKKLHSEVKK